MNLKRILSLLKKHKHEGDFIFGGWCILMCVVSLQNKVVVDVLLRISKEFAVPWKLGPEEGQFLQTFILKHSRRNQ